MTSALKDAWDEFMSATEVQPACQAYAHLRAACGVVDSVKGHAGFQAIAAATTASGVNFRIKDLIKRLGSNWDSRSGHEKMAGCRVVISGAGPIGLRAAVEAALMGMDVTVLEKRTAFSRVNILTLWKQTADDLAGFGAKAFYPKFTNLGERLHLGTREIQLVLLKNALLLGVRLLYGTTLVGVQAPSTPKMFSRGGGADGSWYCWAKGGWSSDDFKAPVLTAAALAAADLAADAEDEAERMAIAAMPDVVSSAMIDLSEELNVIQKGSLRERMAALERQSSTGAASAAASPASASKPTRKKALGLAAMFEKAAAEAEESAAPTTPQKSAAAQGSAATTPKKAPGSPIDLGALDFKPSKMSDYERAANQGVCNYMQTSELDRSFALEAGAAAPAGEETSRYAFDALLLAEGEWSSTCKKLGVTKAIDRFSLAIGLVINMEHDEADAVVKQLKPIVESAGLGPNLAKLNAAGIACENVELLKGDTLYIAATVKKPTLLAKGALKEDLPGQELLTRQNVDDEKLLHLARQVATAMGVPPSTCFCTHHPAKLFDFSTRARCLAPFKVLATRPEGGGKKGGGGGGKGGVGGGSGGGGVVAVDLAAQPFLSSSETAWLARNVEEARAEVELKEEEIRNLQAEIVAAAEKAKADATELAKAAGLEISEAQLEDAACNATAYGRERRDVLLRQLHEKHGRHTVAARDQAQWLEQKAQAEGHAQPVPVFPIGDALLEPFWPQGLGSNRGFHSALDAAHALAVMRRDGLHAALLDRQFSYDVMVHVGGAFPPSIIQPGANWRADYTTRYRPEAIVEMTVKYLNPQSKRLCKGAEAIPPWVQEMKDSGKLKKLSVELAHK